MKTWSICAIKELATKVGSGATPTGGETAYKDSGIPLIRSMNVHFGGFRYDGLAFIDEEQAARLDGATVEAHDVLLNITGASIGRVTTAPPELAGARVNQHVCIIRPSERLSPKFLAYFLASPDQQTKIMHEQVGATRQGLTKARILTFDVPLPPASEQQCIVAEIEKQFSRLDAGVAALRRVEANLKRYKTAVLKAASTGQLTADWRAAHKDVEPASKLLDGILRDRRRRWEEAELARMRANGKPFRDDRWKERYQLLPPTDGLPLPGLPASWTTATLEQLTDPLRVICYGILMPKEDVPDGVLYVRVVDLRDDRVNLATLKRTAPDIAEQYRRASLKAGDVLLAIRGSYGRVAVVPAELDGGNITQDTARLAAMPGVDARWLSVFLRSPIAQNYFKEVARGVAVKGVNIGDIRPMTVPLPPIEEQKVIVEIVEDAMSILQAGESAVEQNLRRAAKLRQSVLKEAFEGRLVKQAPTDEPATQLLNRIRTKQARQDAVVSVKFNGTSRARRA